MSAFEVKGYGLEVYNLKYPYPGEKSWSDRAKVVGKFVASAESDEDMTKYEKKFNSSLLAADFIPGGRIIFGAGRNMGNQNMLNCFALAPEDTVESIGKTVQDMYRISCAGGGVGLSFGKIRPRGDDIQNIPNSAPGSISVMKMVNEVGNHVKAGKNRRTALLGSLPVTHPDVLEFLSIKLDQQQLTNFNISVGITQRFIEACQNDEDWYFFFNNKQYYTFEVSTTDGRKVKTVALNEEDAIARASGFQKIDWNDEFVSAVQVPYKAKDLWNYIWKHAIKSGDPGILNIDYMKSHTNVNYFEEIEVTNPCGEIPLPAYGNCCLGHVNLNHMVLEDGSDVDWKKLARTVRSGVRFLDNVLTINGFPLEECKSAGHRSRRIGLGVTGLHYMLIKLGLRYGSPKSLEFVERLFTTIRNEAYISSAYLARDKGSFAAFDRDKYLAQPFAKELPARIRMLIRQHGIRNAVSLTLAPVGTTSIVFRTSTGVEPIFSPMYFRNHIVDGLVKETVVMDPLFKEYLESGKDVSHFVGAYDVNPEEHIAMQVAIQKYIDNSISKTINLPENYNDLSDEDFASFSDFALESSKELKGLTIYRAGSKGNEPLRAIPTTSENIEKHLGLAVSENATADSCSLDGGDCG
jgi:ribonucleoside-diphosphate reductase alpha chain